MSIQGYSGLFSVFQSLINRYWTSAAGANQAGWDKVFLKGTLTSIQVISSVMIGQKSPRNFLIYSCLFHWREGGWRHVTGPGFPGNNNLPIRPEISPANLTLPVCQSNTKRQRGKWERERWRKWHPPRANVCVQDGTSLAKKFRKKLTLGEMEEAGCCKRLNISIV